MHGDLSLSRSVCSWCALRTDLDGAGGETNFPRLGLDVAPRKGRALLWPSVLSDAPTKRDDRTYHQAKDVLQGVKYAANAWIHSFNFRVPNRWGCSGAFD